MAYFGYEGLLEKLTHGATISWVGRWALQEQNRLWVELLEFPQVDQFGVLLEDPEEEEEEKEVGEGVEKVAGGSWKGKEVARD